MVGIVEFFFDGLFYMYTPGGHVYLFHMEHYNFCSWGVHRFYSVEVRVQFAMIAVERSRFGQKKRSDEKNL